MKQSEKYWIVGSIQTKIAYLMLIYALLFNLPLYFKVIIFLSFGFMFYFDTKLDYELIFNKNVNKE